ncbi:MAG TPA: C45 family peptidase, partial [Bryobacteraceae bacterium]|nr:C45 family peptidase [Bryobacteraceae bacterium]
MPKTAALLLVLAFGLSAAPAREPQNDPRLKKSLRRPDQNGWIFVHLEGSPSEIGFQHGYLLAPEIEDAQKVVALGLTHDSKKDYAFFRNAAEKVLWPRIEAQYREELKGIAEGLKAKNVPLDLWDVVVLNAWLELTPYYTGWYDQEHKLTAANRPVPEHCSAFVATGSYTKDGKIVIAHNNWTEYKEASRWNIIFDIAPQKGYRFMMDGMPGLIHSGDDFGLNTAGIVITETTIGYFAGFDPNGIPEFVRARKAMQYSSSIDDFARIMKDGNNGGYANNWLVADTRKNEIASLELGLKHVTLQRTKDGYFVGSNFPENAELIRDEAPEFPVKDMSISANARHVRWEQLMA